MSLLIKALESAEKGKQAELRKNGAGDAVSADLVLEPLSDVQPAVGNDTPSLSPAAELPGKAASFNTAAAAGVAKTRQQSDVKKDSDHQLAANVFVANQAAQNSTSPTALLMLGVAGALTIWLGLQGYQYIGKLNVPEAVLVRPPSQVAATAVTVSPAVPPVQVAEAQTGVEAPVAAVAPVPESVAPVAKPAMNAQGSAHEAAALTGDTAAARNTAVDSRTPAKKIIDSRAAEYADVPGDGYAEPKKGVPLKLVSRTPAAGVDPTLLAAYQAYSRGDDAAAQKQYRQVLQSDIRNVDALLGMAAIAVRQSRYADANGWYQKVLEIEPRNSTALSAIANSQISTESVAAATADNAGTESRIKSMLAQQPEAANLHAALGNLYAAQNQWPLAQMAYFNASRYAPNSADYAFNLAISLDQLGKPALALAQYQRALALLNNSGDANSPGASNLDKAQLEARIQALQN